MSGRIRAVLFDKDGTLVDFNATWLVIAERMALRAAGGDEGRARAFLEIAGFDFERRCFRADSVFAAGTNTDIVALWYPGLPADERAEIVHHFDTFTATEGAAQAVGIDGAVEALGLLHARGFKLGVATNDSTEGAEKTVLTLGVAQMFDAVYGYDAVANPKPAPDALLAFADLAGCHPSEVAMVGDNRHDLEMARAAGAGLSIGVLSGTGSRKSLGALADVILGSVSELPAYLAALHEGYDSRRVG